MSFAQLEAKLLEVLLENDDRAAPFATPFDAIARRLDAESAAHWLAAAAVQLARGGEERPTLLRYKVVAVRKYRPSFYHDVQVFECWVENREARYGTLSYLEFENRLVVLKGQSPVIHNVNRSQDLNLPLEHAAEYLRFFGWHVRGEAGPFVMADDPRLLPWAEDAPPELRERVASRLRTIVPERGEAPLNPEQREAALRRSGQVPEVFNVVVTVPYEGGLSPAPRRSDPRGPGNMVEDEPLETNLPVYRWLSTPHGALFQEPPPKAPA